MNCPACGSPGEHKVAETWRDPVGGTSYSVRTCGRCGVQFADPFRNPGADWYARFSDAASYEESSKHHFREALRGQDGRGKRLLDIGCGAGAFLEMAAAAGFEVYGTDINSEAAGRASARGAGEVFSGDLKAFALAHPGLRFQLVTYFDCIEHLDDPNGELELIKALLSEDGRLVLTTPNNDRPLPFGREPWDYPPHHLTRWTAPALAALLRRRGFRVERMESGYLPVWEFSRHFINAVRELLMRAARGLLLPKAAGAATFSEASAAGGAGLPAPFRSSAARRRLVNVFHLGMHALTFPFFVWFKVYYLLLGGGRGIQLFAAASKAAPDSGV